MINMINTLLIVLWTMSLTNAQAAPHQDQPPRAFEEKGTGLLKKASEKLRSFNTVKIAFSYVMENPNQDIREEMSGTLVSKGEKYHMSVGSNVFISDGTTVWAYMEDLDEVHVNLVENSDGALTPTSILEEFDTQFKATFIRQEQQQGKLVDIIDLVPHAPQVFFKYRVALNARDNTMVHATAYDRHGGSYTYTINKFETNTPVADTLFTFSESEYPDVDVIDLR